MTSFALNNIASPEVRREIEMRLELWQQIIGSGPPESFCARARSAGYKMPRARGFRIDLSESLEFSAQTGADAAPYFEFSVGVSLALRALCAAMIASEDILGSVDNKGFRRV